MSKRKGTPVSEDEQESTDTEAAKFFQFIDLSSNDPDLLKKNRTKARSHAMKNVRRRMQKEQEDKDVVVFSTKELTDILKDLYSQQFSTQMGQSPLTPADSSLLRLEAELNPTLTFQGRWSPLAHRIPHDRSRLPTDVPGHFADLRAVATMVISSLSPSSANKTTASAMKTCHAAHACPMTFHSVVSGVAAARDYLFNPPLNLSKSFEGLAHRGEALRLINENLSSLQGDANAVPSDELLLSVLSMTAEVPDPEASRRATARQNAGDSKHPFRLPLMPMGWEQQFVSMRHNRMHHNALFALVERKGGLAKLGNRPIAKMISNHDVLVAALDLAPPKQPYIEVDEITRLMGDISLNVLPEPEDKDEARPGALIGTLTHFGVPHNLLSLLHELDQILIFKEAVPSGLVKNLNLLTLTSRQQALHHAILSLPPQSSPSFQVPPTSCTLYEPLRLVLQIFSTGILFPLPPSTGTLARLVLALKSSLDASLDGLPISAQARVLIWILFVGAVAARGMEERAWFVERLAGLCEWEGVARWKEVKSLVRGYVWCGDAMDEEAMEVWDDVRSLIYGYEDGEGEVVGVQGEF